MHVFYFKDPPHLDFLDLEMNAEKLEDTRRQMIHGDRGGIAFKGKILLDDKHIIENGRIKYTFMPIHDSPYRFFIKLFYKITKLRYYSIFFTTFSCRGVTLTLLLYHLSGLTLLINKRKKKRGAFCFPLQSSLLSYRLPHIPSEIGKKIPGMWS